MAAGKKTPTPGTGVAVTGGAPKNSLSALQTVSDEATLAELDGVEGAGLSTNVEDLGTPLLYIAQKGSKQVNKKEPVFIEGLEVGMSFNTITGEFFDTENEPVEIFPCFFRVRWNEWTPLSAGGGFHGSHPRDTPLQTKGKQRGDRRDIIDMPDGHELILTHEYFCILARSMMPIVIPMSSSQLSASGRIQGLINAQKLQTPKGIITKPAFWSTFGLKTVYTKNDKGDWYKFAPSLMGPSEDKNVRDFCKSFALACQSNAVKVAAPPAQTEDDGKLDDDDDSI